LRLVTTAAIAMLLTALSAGLLWAGPLDPLLLEPPDMPTEKPDRPASAPATAPPQSPEKPKSKTIETDKEARRLTVMGQFIGASGVIELGACAKGGKTYLASVVLDARPSEIAEAMKALGFEPGQVPTVDLKNGTASAPQGPKVIIYVEWETALREGKVVRRIRLEHLFWERAGDRLLPDSPWLYAGGQRVRAEGSDSELFTADLSGSVATTNRLDTSALFYYGGELATVQAWRANPGQGATAGTPCRFVVEPVVEPKPPAESAPPQTPGPQPAPQPTPQPPPPNSAAPPVPATQPSAPPQEPRPAETHAAPPGPAAPPAPRQPGPDAAPGANRPAEQPSSTDKSAGGTSETQ